MRLASRLAGPPSVRVAEPGGCHPWRTAIVLRSRQSCRDAGSAKSVERARFTVLCVVANSLRATACVAWGRERAALRVDMDRLPL